MELDDLRRLGSGSCTLEQTQQAMNKMVNVIKNVVNTINNNITNLTNTTTTIEGDILTIQGDIIDLQEQIDNITVDAQLFLVEILGTPGTPCEANADGFFNGTTLTVAVGPPATAGADAGCWVWFMDEFVDQIVPGSRFTAKYIALVTSATVERPLMVVERLGDVLFKGKTNESIDKGDDGSVNIYYGTTDSGVGVNVKFDEFSIGEDKWCWFTRKFEGYEAFSGECDT